MKTKNMGKALAGSDRQGFSGKLFSNCLNGNREQLSSIGYTNTRTELQEYCNICNPLPARRSAAKLCAQCSAQSETLAATLNAHLQQNKTVVRLHRCLSCNECYVPSKFSNIWAICKNCVLTVQDKSKIAQSNFVERTANNVRKVLRRMIAL
ncbi:MAG: hypothetical protein ACR2L1_07495 [Pyrinomonadaceae bacterium]